MGLAVLVLNAGSSSLKLRLSLSLPYVAVSGVAEPLERVEAPGGSVVHPGEAWAICKDSERAHSGWRRSLSKGRSGPTPRPSASAAYPHVDVPGSERAELAAFPTCFGRT